MNDHAHRNRLGRLAVLAAGVALFASSLAGIASVDGTLSAAAPPPPVVGEELRVVQPLHERGGSDCPRERPRHLRDL